MPAALSIDKDFVKSLYVNGVPPARIAEQTGVRLDTICQWVKRGKWKAELPAEKPPEEIAIKNVAEEINGKALSLARKILCKVEDLKLTDLASCKTASSALAAAYATAHKASGQDQDKGPRSVIAIFQGAVPPSIVVQGESRAVPVSAGPIIDVPDVPASDTQSDGGRAEPNNDGHSESVPDSQSNPQSNEPLKGEQSTG